MVRVPAYLWLPACVALWLVVETCLGSRRRGNSYRVALISGLCFPVAWAVWYVRDERPYSQGSLHRRR